MATKKVEYTDEKILEIVETIKSNKYKDTDITIPFMDSYVAKYAKDKMEVYIEKCLNIPMKETTRNGETVLIKDAPAIRGIFMELCFPENTRAVLEKKKLEAKEIKEKEAKLKKEFEELPADKKFKANMYVLSGMALEDALNKVR